MHETGVVYLSMTVCPLKRGNNYKLVYSNVIGISIKKNWTNLKKIYMNNLYAEYFANAKTISKTSGHLDFDIREMESIYCNGMALPRERFWWMTARWPASAIRSRKLSINVASIKAWARPTLEILPKSQNHTNEYLAKCVTSCFLVWLVVSRLIVIRYSKHSPGLRLSFVSLR